MRLIDADALKITLDTFAVLVGFRGMYDRGQTMECIDAAPTVCVPQDAPLRCRTCSFFVTTDCVTGGCSMFGGARTADDYCSKGAWISNAAD